MNQTTEPRQTWTHHIRIPPLTDIAGLLGSYHNLFVAAGCTSNIPYRSEGSFSHPIPESQQQLLNDFMNVNQKLFGLKMDYEHIVLEDIKLNPAGLMATFFVSMQEKQDYVLFPQF